MTRVLVACVGNIFLGDDGFGTEVAAALRSRVLPGGEPLDEVRVEDFGIRSVHLVYELLTGYDVLVLVDTVAHQDGPSGTLYVIEPDLPPRGTGADPPPEVMLDPHDLSPGGVMTLVPTLGGSVDRIVVVGCQPGSLEEGIGLTDEVRNAVEPAADLVCRVLEAEMRRKS
ncbi:hydrogenase maturation protease [Nocardioides sp. MAHUQ-72]|uniref:hydrogenase maturation protease n=1 Tax=unclassified Nocardioides TaxID=2615069 RepID=UPI00360F5979